MLPRGGAVPGHLLLPEGVRPFMVVDASFRWAEWRRAALSQIALSAFVIALD
jgi:hypothetical protein